MSIGFDFLKFVCSPNFCKLPMSINEHVAPMSTKALISLFSNLRFKLVENFFSFVS